MTLRIRILKRLFFKFLQNIEKMNSSSSFLLIALWACTSSSLGMAEDILRVGVVAFPSGAADPHRSVSVFSTYTWSPTFETLTTFTDDGELIGELATDWKQLEPNLWTFSLRKDAVFSNGRPFTAHDVAWSFNYLRTPHGLTAAVNRDLAVIESATAIDDHTVSIKTKIPSAILPRLMTPLYFVEPDHWEKVGPEQFAFEPIGTGPFTITKWQEGKVTYKANPQSWRPPIIEGIEILLLPEVTTRLQALLTGRIDVAIGMGPDDSGFLQSVGGRLHQRQPIDAISITLVIEEGRPAADIRVRRALNYAVDKDAIADVLLNGYTKPATQGAVRGLFGYDPDLKSYPYDPDKARALLKDADYEDGFSLDVEVITGSNASDSAVYQLVASNLADVNVELRVMRIPTSQMVRIILQGQWRGDGFSQIFGSWPSFEPLRTIRLHSCANPTPWFCDEQITPTIQAAKSAISLEDRLLLTQKVLRFYHDQATTILLHEVPLLDGVTARVANYAPNKGKINYETISLEN